MEENNTILVSKESSTGIIAMNRLQCMNAVNLEMLNEIAYQIQNWELILHYSNNPHSSSRSIQRVASCIATSLSIP